MSFCVNKLPKSVMFQVDVSSQAAIRPTCHSVEEAVNREQSMAVGFMVNIRQAVGCLKEGSLMDKLRQFKKSLYGNNHPPLVKSAVHCLSEICMEFKFMETEKNEPVTLTCII